MNWHSKDKHGGGVMERNGLGNEISNAQGAGAPRIGEEAVRAAMRSRDIGIAEATGVEHEEKVEAAMQRFPTHRRNTWVRLGGLLVRVDD
jgi:hypothetical protein